MERYEDDGGYEEDEGALGDDGGDGGYQDEALEAAYAAGRTDAAVAVEDDAEISSELDGLEETFLELQDPAVQERVIHAAQVLANELGVDLWSDAPRLVRRICEANGFTDASDDGARIVHAATRTRFRLESGS